MSPRKGTRERLRSLRELGIDVERVHVGGKTHQTLLLHYCGERRRFSVSLSPSDSRGAKNFIADVRRWKNEVTSGGK